MLKDEIHYASTEHSILGGFAREVNSVKRLVQPVEDRVGASVGQTPRGLLCISSENNVDAVSSFFEHRAHHGDVIKQWVDHADEVAQRILEPDPSGSVRVNLFRQRKHLKIWQSIFLGEPLDDLNTFIRGSVVDHYEFIVARGFT